VGVPALYDQMETAGGGLAFVVELVEFGTHVECALPPSPPSFVFLLGWSVLFTAHEVGRTSVLCRPTYVASSTNFIF
jgi:hypothetical protein